MRHVVWVVIGVALAGMPGTAAWAADPPPAAPARDRVEAVMTRYNVQPALEKLGRGASNLLCGWLEIPYNIHVRSSRSDTGGSFFTGAVHGVVRGVVRTAVGLYETVTFFIPLPEQYAPILPTLAYFDTTNRSERLPLE